MNWFRSPAFRWTALVFLIALFLRASQPQTIYFRSDQTRDIVTARQILAGNLTTRGPIIGPFKELYLGPLYYYVVALGLSIRDQPVDAYRLLAVLNACGVAGFYLLLRRMLGPKEALSGGLVLAALPLAVLNARAIWNPSLVIPSVVVYVAGLWLWVGERRAVGLGILLVGAALMVQTHVSTIFLLPLMALAIRFRPPWRHRGNLVGVVAALGMTLPWIVPQIRSLFTDGSPLGDLDELRAIAEARHIATISFLEGLFWTLAPEVSLPGFVAPAAPPSWSVAAQVAGAVFTVLVLLGGVQLIREARGRPVRTTLLAGAAILPAVCLALLPSGYLHYLELTFPFRAVLAVFGAGLLGRWIGRVPAAAILVLSVVIGLTALAGTVEREARTEVIQRDPNYFDFFRVQSGDDDLVVFPTVNALQNVGRILALDLGLRPEDLPQCARGPWWLPFVEDVGFWIREPHHRGLPVRRCAEKDEAILLRHRDDPFPWPAAVQRHATYGAGPFTVLSLRSGFRWTVVDFHLPDHNRPGDWFPGLWLMSGRLIPNIRYAETHLRLGYTVPDPPPARIFILTQTAEEHRWKRVVVAGKSLERDGTLRFRNRYVCEWFRWDRPTAGDHYVEFHSRRTPRKKKITLSLDVIDIWQDR